MVTKVEIAKNQYDQDAKTADKKRFDLGTDDERYNRLAPTIGVSDPLDFTKGTGIKRLKINKLGFDVETE